MSELLGCPFCGEMPNAKEWLIGEHTQIKIWCDGDTCHVYPSLFGNKKSMVEIWNTRLDNTYVKDPREVANRVYSAMKHTIDGNGDLDAALNIGASIIGKEVSPLRDESTRGRK